MKLEQLVTIDRVEFVLSNDLLDKRESLRRIALLLSRGLPVSAEVVGEILTAREALQSTGIGDGVAIPHGTLLDAPNQIGAVLLCPGGVEFDSIDRSPVKILFGVVGPCQAVEHLKVLARISRLLRSSTFRDELLAERVPSAAFALLQREDTESP